MRRLVKAPILYYLLADWFYKSLLPKIAKEISLGGTVIEDQSIHCTQHLDLIYS